MLIVGKQVCKFFGDQDLFTIPSLEIAQGDRIGIVGANGSGKTTLLRILAGELEPDAGSVKRYCDVAYIRQMENVQEEAEASVLGEFQVLPCADALVRSGGEDTRVKIAQALSHNPLLLFADEPTANLDADGCVLLQKKLDQVQTLVLVSHDRALLDAQCTSILELREGTLFPYPGNYTFYREQRKAEKERAYYEYAEYTRERARLEEVARDTREKAKGMTKGPKGISNSEAKMRSWMMTRKPDVKERRMAQTAKAVEKRIDRLQVKEKPRELPTIRMDFSRTDPPMGRFISTAEDLSFGYGGRLLLDSVSFQLPNQAKIAVTGKNGAGKTTLLNLLAQGHPAIRTAPKVRFGYFRQKMDDIDLCKSALDNMLRDSVQGEGVARTLLARLLFRGNDVFKPAGVLSGGERIKLSLAMLLTKPCNVLLLDEPTNYLDLPSIEAVQALLQEYEGTILFVSHDLAFAQAVATASMHIEGGKVVWNPDGLASRAQQASGAAADRIVLEHRKALLISQFGDPHVDQAVLRAELAEINALLQ